MHDAEGQSYLLPDEEPTDELGLRVILFTPSLGLWQQFPESDLPEIAQRTSELTGIWNKRFTYNLSTFEGDCGSPIVVRGGKVLGMHVSPLRESASLKAVLLNCCDDTCRWKW